jgi:hypothetical protein
MHTCTYLWILLGYTGLRVTLTFLLCPSYFPPHISSSYLAAGNIYRAMAIATHSPEQVQIWFYYWQVLGFEVWYIPNPSISGLPR